MNKRVYIYILLVMFIWQLPLSCVLKKTPSGKNGKYVYDTILEVSSQIIISLKIKDWKDDQIFFQIKDQSNTKISKVVKTENLLYSLSSVSCDKDINNDGIKDIHISYYSNNPSHDFFLISPDSIKRDVALDSLFDIFKLNDSLFYSFDSWAYADGDIGISSQLFKIKKFDHIRVAEFLIRETDKISVDELCDYSVESIKCDSTNFGNNMGDLSLEQNRTKEIWEEFLKRKE